MLYNSYKRSQQYILSEKPDAFIGCGGFVSGPVGLAAKKLRIPIYLQEQNSYPGITTKYLAKSARKVFTAYDNAKNYLGKATLVKCGNPTGISNQNTETLNMEKFGLSKVNKKLLVLGGSQGSVVINKAIESILDELQKRNIDIIWQTGKHNFLELKQKYGDRKGIFMFAFTNIMNEMYNTADFAVCRAGALTLSELQIKKIPAILIPLPTAAENHQYYNAEELTQKGMAVMLEQKFLTPGTFLKAIDGLLENLRNYKKSFPETNYNVAGIIAETISKDFGV
jgi:UDP-N-acetylglucosamine--N-acetylmuramyl-(pentapeptide) pyrophosphoryl-undecaprenol N-acetylglucosamine transferase